VLQTIGVARWPEVRELYHALVLSRSNKVKQTLACSLHEVARILGDVHSGDSLSIYCRSPVFFSLIRLTDDCCFYCTDSSGIGGTSLVEVELIPVFESMLQVLYLNRSIPIMLFLWREHDGCSSTPPMCCPAEFVKLTAM
jgi:hypothetical protein